MTVAVAEEKARVLERKKRGVGAPASWKNFEAGDGDGAGDGRRPGAAAAARGGEGGGGGVARHHRREGMGRRGRWWRFWVRKM